MRVRVLIGVFAAIGAISCATAEAASLPEVRATKSNQVPACATPGRLTLYMQSRNKTAEPKFLELANAYQQYGKVLGLRWDYAYFQMLHETNFLSFRGGMRSTVAPAQNNFAGLGAVDSSAGESFADVSTGALAHLQHLMLYAGAPVANPVADRTRKVQQWGTLAKWHKSRPSTPMTFNELLQQWAKSDSSYPDSLDAIAKKFYAEFCTIADPLGASPQIDAAVTPEAPAAQERGASAALKPDATTVAERMESLTQAGATGGKSSLGAGTLIQTVPAAPATDTTQPAAAPNAAAEIARPTPQKNRQAESKPAAQTAALKPDLPRNAAPQMQPSPPAATNAKCNVWTASYGGGKAVIVKSQTPESINYTVLEVTTANAAQELQSYIKIYAKGGEKIAEFPDQAKALDQAFQLCPEG